ncbi:MAG: glycerol-3-phosphate 1-O-acyltransferase PlsY [Phycisphaerales bacterium]
MTLMALVAFACGSVPFGVLIARAHGRDIMQEGSRNPGATNVGRVLGKPWGFLCFGLDFLKGFVPVAIAGHEAGLWGRAAAEMSPTEQLGWVAIAAAAMLGHMFSPWIRFKGGKGVATAFGGLAALWPAVTVPVLVAFGAWVAVVAITRYVSLASIIAAAMLPLATLGWAATPRGGSDVAGAWPLIAVNAALGALVIWKHRANIARLRAGTENRVGGAKAT